MGWLFGIPQKLIRRVTEIEIDSHYYDNDVVPSNQDLFDYNVNTNNKTSEILGFKNKNNNIAIAVIPYRVKYGNETSHLFANVTSIANKAFANSQYLIDITIPNTIHEIPYQCFKNCTSLQKVNIPKSVRTIKTEAFSGCTDLRSVFIPFTVNSIEENAFKDCSKLKIICYKNSTAEIYAKANDIPYSLLSYSLDDDVTENSQNLITSGTLYTLFKNLRTNITNHINNKVNPHDSATFNNIKITGDSEYTGDIEDNNNLVNKKYVDDSINNINISGIKANKTYQTIETNLITGWNIVSTNKLYEVGWMFLGKPFCHINGTPIDFQIRNYKDNIQNNEHCFEIHVDQDCKLECATTNSDLISGYAMDYIIVNYYYTALDGKDLDTVTNLVSGTINGVVGYSSGEQVKVNDKILLCWAGDNTGGGSSETDKTKKFYESTYIDLNAVTSETTEDTEIILYATWFSEQLNGNINISFDCYTGTNVTFTANNKLWTISGSDIVKTFSNNKELQANVSTFKGNVANYKTTYTPILKILISNNASSNIRNIKLELLN